MARITGSAPKALWSQATRSLQSMATAPTRAVRGLGPLKGVALMKGRAASQALDEQWRQAVTRPPAAPPVAELSKDVALRRAARQRIRLEGVSPDGLPPELRAAYLRGQQAQTPTRFQQNARRALAEGQSDMTALHPTQQRAVLEQARQRSSRAAAKLARGHAQGSAAQNASQLEEDRLKGQATADFRVTARVATMGASESAIAARQAAMEGRWLAAAGQGGQGAVQTAMAATSVPGLGLLARGGLGLARAGVSGLLAAAKNPLLISRAAGAGLKTAETALPQVPGLLARAPGAAWNAVSQAPVLLATTASNTWNAGRAAMATGVTGTQVVQGMAIAGNTVDTGMSAGRALTKCAAGNWSGAMVDGLAATLAARAGVMPTGVNRMMGDRLADTQRRLSTAIETACASTDEAVRLEGQAAKAIRKDVIGFQKKVVDPATGKTLAEIDIETPHALVEVTNARGAKAGQLEDYFKPEVNPESKSVVLYAPRYTKAGEQHLESEGFFQRGLAGLVRTEEQLQRAIDITSALPRVTI